MERLANLLNGKIINNTIVVQGQFDEVRAERICERHGCTFRYQTVRDGWQKLPGSGWSKINRIITIFTF